MSWGVAALELELSELDDVALLQLDVGLGPADLGDHALAGGHLLLDLTGPGDVVSMHVRVGWRKKKN